MNNATCREKYVLPDFNKQAVPFFHWTRLFLDRVPLANPGTDGKLQEISFPLEIGYAFFMSEIFFRQEPVVMGTIKIEVISKMRGRNYQLVPFYPRLISSPGDVSTGPVYQVAAAPVDNGAMNRSTYAINGGPKSRIQVNQYYHYAENIFVTLNMTQFLNTMFSPGYADIILSGYKIPQKNLKMWGNAR